MVGIEVDKVYTLLGKYPALYKPATKGSFYSYDDEQPFLFRLAFNITAEFLINTVFKLLAKHSETLHHNST